MQTNVNFVWRGCDAVLMLDQSLWVHVLDLVKALEKSDDGESSQGQSMLLSQADTGPAIEGQKLPSGFVANPSLWSELVCIRAPDVLSMVHNVNGVVDFHSFPDEDGRLLIWTTTDWQAGIFCGSSAVEGNSWEESQRF